jgi:hypothetical protein
MYFLGQYTLFFIKTQEDVTPLGLILIHYHFLPDLCEMAAKNLRFFAAISHKSGKK